MVTIQQAYDRWAATYDTDRNLTRDLDAQVTAEALSGRRWGTAVEWGCGTGKNTALLAQMADDVVALDFSPAMMGRAQRRVTDRRVRFVYGDVTRPWPLADGSADLIVANLVLEHVEDLGFVFGEAARCLVADGRFFNSELHPFKQYQNKKAVFERDGKQIEIGAFVHHLSDFVNAATANGLSLVKLGEWWHEEDGGKPPRLLTFVWGRGELGN